VSGSSQEGWSRVALSAAALVVVVGGAAVGAALAASGTAPPVSGTPHGASAAPLKCGAGAPKITETGTGTVAITPNLLTLSLDVHTTAPQASRALSLNNEVTAKVLHALSTGGVARRDLQTTDLTIEPNYANTGTTVRGYSVDNSVIAKIRRFSTAGTVIDAAVAAGGNATRIDSLAFLLTKPLRAQARARDLAVRQAVGHARAIAASANERIGGICSIDDQTTTSTTTPVVPYGNLGTAAPSAHGIPVESGSETVTARVSVVFALG
jgi:uncharacterized protein